MQELKAQPRTITGKAVKILRQQGFLPGVLYGAGVTAQSIVLPLADFEKAYKEAGESTLVKLIVDGVDHTVLIHDMGHDPLRGTAIHADFYAVRMDKALRIKVPVVFTGESGAVKNEGAILIKVVQELEVEAMPAHLPHELRANLAMLSSMDARITVGDLPHESKVKIIAPIGEVIALVEPPRSDEAMAELAAVPAGELKEVKTEREVMAEEKSKEVPAEEE